MNRNRPTSRISVTACALLEMGNRSATSHSPSCCTAIPSQVIDHLVGEFVGVFTNADGNLFTETYNQLNAYFATVPGNYALNLRKLYLLNSNYADLSFLFTILPGENAQHASRRGVSGSP